MKLTVEVIAIWTIFDVVVGIPIWMLITAHARKLEAQGTSERTAAQNAISPAG